MRSELGRESLQHPVPFSYALVATHAFGVPEFTQNLIETIDTDRPYVYCKCSTHQRRVALNYTIRTQYGMRMPSQNTHRNRLPND